MFIRRIIAIFMVLTVSLAIVKNSVVMIFYDYNTNLFIELFCENKDDATLNCEGQCKIHQLKQNQKQENAALLLDFCNKN